MHWLTNSIQTICILLVITTCAFCYSLGKVEGCTQGRIERDRELDFSNHRTYELLIARQDL
ncbi:MAG TPA: hypothetical protein VG269_06800 [Tepidisphaeraceae bacterium]|jgi:hypothetical protein|nr:hypothetical protein [Tepidisphaeraceae bacterium]